MSDEEEQNSEEEEEENQEEDEDGDEDEDEDGDQDGDEDQDQDQDEDQNEEEDEEEDGSGEGDGSGDEEQGDGSNQQSKEEEGKREVLPKFRSVEPEQFKFTNLLSQISSLSLTVDNFINTLPSHGGSHYRSSYIPPPIKYTPIQIPPLTQKQQPKIVIMKDQDIQVSMQPQIVIQATKIQKPQEQQSYKISNESSKFLAQLYEQNKKLKRWQNSSHNMNSHQGNSSSGFYGSRDRFQRQDYEKGLFNVEERNKEIDEAIEMLKREEED